MAPYDVEEPLFLALGVCAITSKFPTALGNGFDFWCAPSFLNMQVALELLGLCLLLPSFLLLLQQLLLRLLLALRHLAADIELKWFRLLGYPGSLT